MKHLVSKFRVSSLLRAAAIAGLGLTVSGCVYDAGLGLGYASDGYSSDYGCDGYNDFNSYYGCDSGYGFSNIGYGGGWYSDYYYPGYGFFVFDSYGRRYQMHNDHSRYWGGQRYNWHRNNGRGRGHGNHHDGGNNYGGHNGGRGNHGNGNGGHHDGDNNNARRPGLLDGGFGRRGSRSNEGRGSSIQNPAEDNTANAAPQPRNIDRGNRGDRSNGMLNGGFGRRSQDGGATAQTVRQMPQAAAPRAAPVPRQDQGPKERTESLRRPQEK